MTGAILVTGVPGVGKTTLVLNVVEAVRSRGYLVGGMITREIRVDQRRVGFEILDLLGGERGILSHIDVRDGPRVGKYGVNITGLEGVGVTAIRNALRQREVDLLVIDEIGPMELASREFRSAAREAITGDKSFLGTVQLRLCRRIPEVLSLNVNPETFELTRENRVRLSKIVSERILEILGAQA